MYGCGKSETSARFGLDMLKSPRRRTDHLSLPVAFLDLFLVNFLLALPTSATPIPDIPWHTIELPVEIGSRRAITHDQSVFTAAQQLRVVTMRPKILMIHGGGTTPDIFRIQARKLDAALSQFFDLHYVSAPIECPAGPGVLPFFAGMGPFLKWMHDQPPDLEDLDTFPALHDMLQVFHTEGPFDGIVAFSQGAKAALHLLRHLERDRGGDRAVDFVITVCPTCPFQGIKDPKDRRSPYARACLELGKVQTESIHVLASSDPYNYESESMIEFFEASARKVFRIEGGHHMPMDDGFNRKLAEMAARIYNGI